MIKRIVRLQNIGRFRNLSAKGDVTFRRLTLIYGLNGFGKTTLTGVFRSLATGDRAYVDERATLGTSEVPAGEIRLEGGVAKFSNGVWSSTVPHLDIFDSTFVNDNVFTGEHVGADHRKNLYEVVVGATAVALVRDIDRIDSEARQAAASVSEREKEISALVHAPFPLKSFLSLKPELGVTDKISECTARLSAVRKQKEVLARPQLDPLSVPSIPTAVLAVFEKSVAQLSAEAESKVRAHLQRVGHGAEAWLRQGLEYTKDDCPFCAQSLAGVDIVRLYREFFSTAYREHLVEIERAGNLVEQTLGDDALQALHKRVAANDSRIQGWRDLADLGDAGYAPEMLDRRWKHLRQHLRDRLRQKAANPAEPVLSNASFRAAVDDFVASADELQSHNVQVIAANRKIGELKQQSAATKEEALEEELRRLRNIEIRYEVRTVELAGQLDEARAKKKALDDEKASKKETLGEVSATVLADYQTAINRLLARFGANFSIVNARPVFPGGKASSTYQIQLNGMPLDIGDSNTPRGKPCFRTALSTGDKSTLALAFFLARVEREDLSGRCVVIDDPLSSFDSFRTACTQQEMAKVTARAGQTVILSHDAFFLKGILDACTDRSDIKSLQVVRDGATHVIREWNVAEYFLKECHKEYFLMRSFLADGPPENGDLTSIARAIRPYMEGHLRHRFPGEFTETEWLGDFIKKVRAATAGPLAAFRSKLSELEDVNNYSKNFHHSSSTPTPTPTDTELRAWVERALSFVHT